MFVSFPKVQVTSNLLSACPTFQKVSIYPQKGYHSISFLNLGSWEDYPSGQSDMFSTNLSRPRSKSYRDSPPLRPLQVGDRIFVAGSHDDLGQWNPDGSKAVASVPVVSACISDRAMLTWCHLSIYHARDSDSSGPRTARFAVSPLQFINSGVDARVQLSDSGL